MHNDQKVALTLSLFDNDQHVRTETVSESLVRIGSGASSNVRITAEGVARMHAVVEVQTIDDVTLIDLGNLPQTRVNGAPINKHSLKAGDEIKLGDVRIVVDAIEHAAARRVAAAKPLAAAANPFVVPGLDAFSSTAAAGASEGSYEYRIVASEGASPDVDSLADGAEVKISWGSSVLHVEHLRPSQSFYAGETEGKAFGCDYFVPASKLGISRAPLVFDGRAIILPGAAATITTDGKPAMSLDEAAAAGIASPSALVTGAYEVMLQNGMTVKTQLEDITFEVRGTKQARKVAAAFTMAAVTGGAFLYVLGSLLGHAGLLAAMAAFMPSLGSTADEELTDDQHYLMSQYLESASELEKEKSVQELLTEVANPDDTPGGTGTAAKGDSGVMGNESAKSLQGRWGIKGDAEHYIVSKAEALREAANFGAIGLLSSDMGSMDEPTAIWGQDLSQGTDPLSADGLMWGNQIGSAWGPGGLGLTGMGESGGGLGEGIGIGDRGIGHGAGFGCPSCMGFGNGNGSAFLRRGHQAVAPNPVRQGVTKTNGRLPPEVIQRIVRANSGRYRACYQGALKTNPNLQGRVVVSFVIGRSGTVSSVSAGGDLPNQGVISCVGSAFQSLTFPQPEGGIVTVSYPLVFSPAS